jgi:hypothetical protein
MQTPTETVFQMDGKWLMASTLILLAMPMQTLTVTV